jgi:4,5-DOPA dioxygenase extradiol
MEVNVLNNIITGFQQTERMPVMFLGHGNPMNALIENEFYKNFTRIGKEIPKPLAILCISAHWETNGTYVTAMEKPPTIHDFGGFPRKLFEMQYPAPGSPELARHTQSLVHSADIQLDYQWGLDHGAWTVLQPLFPNADVPVIQMSLNDEMSPQSHFDLACQLRPLRDKGVLIIGSGNMVHNLRRAAWDRIHNEFGYDWALEAQEKMRNYILNNDTNKLINYHEEGSAFNLAIPTPEHYLPLLYVLALRETKDETEVFNDKAIAGSLTMTSVLVK